MFSTSAAARRGWIIALLCTAVARAQTSGTAPLIIDGNRAYVPIAFRLADGARRATYAFVDMGRPTMDVGERLLDALGGDGRDVSFDIGGMRVDVPATQVRRESGVPYSLGEGKSVEAVLPAAVLSRFEVVIDYASRRLTLARPGAVHPRGIRVPFHMNRETGLIAVDATIDGRTYALTLDNGSAYTWVRQDSAKTWLAAHPDWERGVGAVGPANMTMAGDETEATGILLRIPRITIGALPIDDVGALAIAGGRGATPGQGLLDWYSTKNAGPVLGWIGGNVLRHYRLTIDYRDRAIYCLRQSPDDAALNQIGLTLRARRGEFLVAAIATRNGVPTVSGARVGDKLVRVGDVEVTGMTLGLVYSAMSGRPGEKRMLVLERDGSRVAVQTSVIAF